MTAQPAEWSKPPHMVYPSSIPEPVCPACGHDEHDGPCPVHRRKLDPCTCDREGECPGFATSASGDSDGTP